MSTLDTAGGAALDKIARTYGIGRYGCETDYELRRRVQYHIARGPAKSGFSEFGGGWSAHGAGYPERPQESGWHILQRRVSYGAATRFYWDAAKSSWFIGKGCAPIGSADFVGKAYNYVRADNRTDVDAPAEQQKQLDNLLENVVKLWNAVNQHSTQFMQLTHPTPASALSDKQYGAAWLAGAKAMQDECLDILTAYGYDGGPQMVINRVVANTIHAKYDGKRYAK